MSLYGGISRDIGLTPYIGSPAGSVTNIDIGPASNYSGTTLPAGDAVSFSSRSMEMYQSYSSLRQSGFSVDGLRYSYSSERADFSFSMAAEDLKADFSGNVYYRGETVNISVSVQVEQLFLEGDGYVKDSNGNGVGNAYGHNRKGEDAALTHVKYSFDLDRTQFESLFNGLNESKGKQFDDRLFKLLRTLSGISIKNEKKSILIIFADEKAVGILADKTGKKVMELVLFIVIASHLNATKQKAHYNIWLHGGDEERMSVMRSVSQKFHFEMDLYIGSGQGRKVELPSGGT